MTVKRNLRAKYWANPDTPSTAATVEHCPLCGRVMVAGASVDEHHLTPKSKGGRDKFRIHKLCHKMIHATLTESQLARDYSRWDLLQVQPDIASFIAWVADKPPEFSVTIRRNANKR